MASVRIYSRDQLRFQLDGLKVDRYTLVDRDGSKPSQTDGFYRINALGSGGFGVVVRAIDRVGMSRAITLFPDLPHLFDEPDETHLSVREIRLANERPYKHVLPILDYGAIKAGTHSLAYYVSQYVAGLSLAEFNHQIVPLRSLIIGADILRARLREVMLLLIRDVLSALVELHASSVVHLDMKPQNILVYPLVARPDGTLAPDELTHQIEAGDLNAFVIDGASAKPIGSDIRGRTTLRWTPYYFPPLFDDLGYTHSDGRVDSEALNLHGRTIDLYSLGRTLEFIFLDRVRRRSPRIQENSELATAESKKESFWRSIFGDDHAVVEGLIDRLLSLTNGFGTADRARRSFEAVSFAPPQNFAEPDSIAPGAPLRGAGLRVFLCHASVDKHLVRDLYGKLKTDGIDVWIDEEALLPGEDWRETIAKAVISSHVVVVCLSKAAITKRGYVQKEIRLALDAAAEQPEGTIFLIPVRLEECEIPMQLSRWQWANLFDANGYAKLLRSLRTRAEELGLRIGEA